MDFSFPSSTLYESHNLWGCNSQVSLTLQNSLLNTSTPRACTPSASSRATTSPFRGGGTKASSILSMGVRHPQSLWHPPRGQLQGEEQVPLPLPFVHHALSPRITPKFVDDDDKASPKICRWRRQSLTIRNGSKLVFLGLVGLRYGIEREWIQKKEMNDDKIVTFITCLVQAKGTKNE